MKPERWDEVDKVLQSMLERPVAEREAYLAEVCSGDEDLRRDVMTLMASHGQAGSSFMASPALEASGGDIFEDEPKLKEGDTIGPYRITKPIGRGGMGEVYLAEHTTQSRNVALKILPGTMLMSPGVSTEGGASATSAAGESHTTSSAEYIVNELKRHRKGVLITVAALAVIAAISFAAYKLWNRSGTGQTADAGAAAHAPKLTPLSINGNVIDGLISPDGKYVVYKLKHDAQVPEVSMWVKHLPTNSIVQIMPQTRDYPIDLSFSADSNYIYYAQRSFDTEVWSASKISVLGGTPKKLIENIRRGDFAPSPDGKQLAFNRVEANGEIKLTVSNEDGTGERVLITRNNITEWFGGMPRWSPDGKLIACLGGSSVGGYNFTPLLVNVADGTQRHLGTVKWPWATSLVWLGDGSGLMVSAGGSSTAPKQVWYISYPDGAARRVTNDLNDYEVKSVTSDSKTLLAVQTITSNDVWVAPIGAMRASSSR